METRESSAIWILHVDSLVVIMSVVQHYCNFNVNVINAILKWIFMHESIVQLNNETPYYCIKLLLNFFCGFFFFMIIIFLSRLITRQVLSTYCYLTLIMIFTLIVVWILFLNIVVLFFFLKEVYRFHGIDYWNLVYFEFEFKLWL